MPDNMNVIDGDAQQQTIATDQVGMAHIQKIKLLDGTPDSGVPIHAGMGAIANALRVVLAGWGVVMPYSDPAYFVSGALSADLVDTTPVELIPAQGEGSAIFLTSIVVTNADESIGTVVQLTDGNGGTVLFRNYAAKSGGGFSVQFPTPLKFSANTPVYIECETADAMIQASVSGFEAEDLA